MPPILGSIELGPGVLRCGTEVHKTYPTQKAARKAYFLFATFPGHAAPLRRNSNILVYAYAKGPTLHEVLLRREVPAGVCREIGRHIASIHFSDPGLTLIPDYGRVCRERRLFPDPTIFRGDSISFRSRIHGDLHPRNVVVGESGRFHFIDRMRNANDILWDLPILLSLLCMYGPHRDTYYLKEARSFLEGYFERAPPDLRFQRGLMHNLVNFSYKAVKYAHNIPEWGHGRTLSLELLGMDSIFQYLDQRKV